MSIDNSVRVVIFYNQALHGPTKFDLWVQTFKNQQKATFHSHPLCCSVFSSTSIHHDDIFSHSEWDATITIDNKRVDRHILAILEHLFGTIMV